jgi:hypothetical protein
VSTSLELKSVRHIHVCNCLSNLCIDSSAFRLPSKNQTQISHKKYCEQRFSKSQESANRAYLLTVNSDNWRFATLQSGIHKCHFAACAFHILMEGKCQFCILQPSISKCQLSKMTLSKYALIMTETKATNNRDERATAEPQYG